MADTSMSSVSGAEVQHLLRLSEATGGRSGEGAPVTEEGEHGDRERLGGCADTDQGAVAAQQPQVGVEVDRVTETVLMIRSKLFARWSKLAGSLVA